MGLSETLVEVFRKLAEFRQTNPKKAFLLALLLFFAFRRFYRKFRQNNNALGNKIVLITGGAMGIGKLVAERCKKENATVIVWDINETELTKVVKNKIADVGMKVDVTSRDSVIDAATKILNEYGYIDILINNAGIVSGKTILQLTEKDVRSTFDVNVISHFWTLQAFLPTMLKRDKGHIVTIASTAGKSGVSYLTDYCASKYACRGLDDSLRHELQDLGKDNIKLTCICPYFINTGMFAGAKAARNWFVRLFVYFLKPERVANEIIDAIKENKREVILPYRLGLMYMLEPILPYFVADALIVNASQMDNFTGRSLNIPAHTIGASSTNLNMEMPK